MRDYYIFPEMGGSIGFQKDSSTGQIRLTMNQAALAYFKPQELVKQLREVANHLEKYGTDGRADKGRFQAKEVG